jgi:mRNA-degrading endonuclease RelE of RelBE toxin-antitoxin system
MAIVITDRFRKAYRAFPKPVQERIQKALRLLDENPRHPSLQVKKIGGTSNIYEARVDRKVRMSFQFDGEDKIMRNVDDHDECLKNP